MGWCRLGEQGTGQAGEWEAPHCLLGSKWDPLPLCETWGALPLAQTGISVLLLLLLQTPRLERVWAGKESTEGMCGAVQGPGFKQLLADHAHSSPCKDIQTMCQSYPRALSCGGLSRSCSHSPSLGQPCPWWGLGGGSASCLDRRATPEPPLSLQRPAAAGSVPDRPRGTIWPCRFLHLLPAGTSEGAGACSCAIWLRGARRLPAVLPGRPPRLHGC